MGSNDAHAELIHWQSILHKPLVGSKLQINFLSVRRQHSASEQ
jgi:hypothetical protein